MAKTVMRPKITVQVVYTGGKDMRELFVSLLVNEVQQMKSPVRTFENAKETQYNLSITDTKEAG